MAAKLTSETRRLYSWWWDSHISPKNSKWLQENLTDLDSKVKAMIKIINEDADSFARRAEMYYKKRPELMKLVEEFYRAYRALAERYDHATGELRLAHRTMIEAFPNQVPFMLSDDPSDDPSSGSESPLPVVSHLEGIFDPDDLNKASDVGFSKKGFKQLNEIFKSGEAVLRELKTAEGRLTGNMQGEEDRDSSLKHGPSQLSDRNHSLDLRTMILNESERAEKVEAEMQRLKQALAKMEAERDAVLAQYRYTLEKLSTLEKELNSAQVDAKEVEKCASEAQSEVKALKESLKKLEVERDSSLYQFEEASKRISSLEAMATAAQGDAAKWTGQAVKAEIESQSLKQDLSRSEAKKQDVVARYQQNLDKISALEERLRRAEENAERLSEQNEQAESEIKALKEEFSRLNKEKEDVFLRYQQCLDVISKLQNELMEAKEEARRLIGEILFGSERLKGAEDQCTLLEEVNQSLKLEANDLVQEIAAKDQQLSEKHTELEKLMNRLQDEESHFTQVEATLHKLQDMHLQSQEDQRALASELRNGLRMLKDLELCKRDLELEIRCLREENRGLNDLKSASSAAEKDMQHEILGLNEIKEKLQANVRRQAEGNEVLQQQFYRLKEELEDLYNKYQDLLQQLECAGIDPNCIKSSIKDLQDENSMHLERLEDMEGLLEKSAALESSLSDVKVELESSKEKMKALQESCNALSGEKSNLMAEKSALLSQLQIITESMQKLLEKNVLLENSLQSANIQLEGLRVKSRSLEDFCQFLKDERSSLQTERCNLVYRLECVEKKLEKLETRFTRLEDKYAGLEKERDSTRNQVDELMISLVAETKERRCLVLTSEVRLSGLEDRIHNLQEENKYGKKNFEEQLEKAVSAQVEIFVLKKFMKDMEERNYTLLEECQKHAEAAKYSERLISELESENMMQHLETEYLLDRVDKLRRGICQVLKALEIDHVSETDPEIFLPRVRRNIKDMRRNLSDSKDENQELLIQNNVLSAVIMELSSEGLELKTRKDAIDHEFFILSQQHVILDREKDELLERSGQLEIVVAEKESRHETLKAQIGNLGLKQESLEKEYVSLQKEHSDVLKENWLLQDKLTHLDEEKHMLEEQNSAAIVEALSLGNQSVVFECSWVQTSLELRRVAQDMCHLRKAYSNLENETRAVRGKLAMKDTENIELNVCNEELNQQCLIERERLDQKEAELLEAERRIKTIQDVNAELNTTIEGLQVQCKGLDDNRGNLELQIFELSKCREHQDKEIGLLQEANGSLENEVGVLCREIEACRIREVVLNSELHEISSEFELWEAEATSFYFDLQISSVHETLLENKVQELSGLCEDLEGSGTRKSMEIESLKNRISFLEAESEGLKSKLDAYVPAIASLKDNVESLEQSPALQIKLHWPATTNQQVAELMVPESRSRPADAKEQSASLPDGLIELQDLQSGVKGIESVLVVEKTSVEDHLQTEIKLDAATKEIKEPKSRNNSLPNAINHGLERKDGNLHGRSRDGTHMKDIPLDYISDASPSSHRRRKSSRLSDQLLGLWEASELNSSHNLALSKTRAQTSPPRRKGSLHRGDSNPEIEKELGVDKLEVSKTVTETKQGGNRKAILERLALDAQKLASLQTSVQELRRKMEINKKSKVARDVEYKRLKGQLHDFESSMVQLVSVNTELTKTIKGSTSSSDSLRSREAVEVEQALRRKMLEQSRRDSERIGSLQLEMQKIQSILVKLEDEKNSIKKGGKSGLLRIRTGIILREFVYGRSRSRKQKKSRFCGCFRPSHKEI